MFEHHVSTRMDLRPLITKRTFYLGRHHALSPVYYLICTVYVRLCLFNVILSALTQVRQFHCSDDSDEKGEKGMCLADTQCVHLINPINIV